MRPWFGLHLPSYTFPDAPPERLFDSGRGAGQARRAAGFGMVTVMDHLYQIGGVGPDTEPMLEALVGARRPVARDVQGPAGHARDRRHVPQPGAPREDRSTTLDVISGGRAILGLGAAWNEVEHEGYGFEFPPIRERMDRLEEALTIARAMFTEDRPSFEGRTTAINDALNVPQADPAGRTADPHRRRWRAADPEDRGEARRHDALVRRSAWMGSAQDRGPRAALRGDRPRSRRRSSGRSVAPVIVAADDAEAKAFLERIPPERRPFIKAARRSRWPTGCGRTSTPASPASRSTTTCTGRRSRSRRVGELLALIGG